MARPKSDELELTAGMQAARQRLIHNDGARMDVSPGGVAYKVAGSVGDDTSVPGMVGSIGRSTLLSNDGRALVEMEDRSQSAASRVNQLLRGVGTPVGSPAMTGQPAAGPVRSYAGPSMSADTGMAPESDEAYAHWAALARHRTGDIYGYGSRAADLRAAYRASGFGVSRPIGRRKDALVNAAADRAAAREAMFAKVGVAREKIAGENKRAAADLAERARQFDANNKIEQSKVKNQQDQIKNEKDRINGQQEQKIASLQNQVATLRQQIRLAASLGRSRAEIANLQARLQEAEKARDEAMKARDDAMNGNGLVVSVPSAPPARAM